MTATPNVIDEIVGGNIRFWRLQREMTVLYVAAALGVSAAHLGSMEAGMTRVGVVDMRTLCSLLRIRPADIYDDRGLAAG